MAITMAFLVTCPCGAGDAKLTPDAQKAVDEFKATLKKEKEKIAQSLQAEVTSETKKGNLDGALEVKNLIQMIKYQKEPCEGNRRKTGESNQPTSNKPAKESVTPANADDDSPQDVTPDSARKLK